MVWKPGCHCLDCIQFQRSQFDFQDDVTAKGKTAREPRADEEGGLNVGIRTISLLPRVL